MQSEIKCKMKLNIQQNRGIAEEIVLRIKISIPRFIMIFS